MIEDSMCYAIWRSNDIKWRMKPTITTTWSYFFIWKEDDFEVHNYFEEEGFLGLQGVCNKVDKEVIIVNVYASCNIDKRS